MASIRISEAVPEEATADRTAPASTHRPLIVTEHLCKRFGPVTAVADLSFDVGPGEVFGFLGPNGAGKTTTIRLLMGFIKPNSGRCSVLAGSLRSQTQLKRRVGYLPGDFRIDPRMSGRDLFRWFGRLRGGIDHKRADQISDRLELDPTRPFGALSKGNRQKIGIVQAFMHDPEVLILDEPTTGLDPLIQREFLSLVREAAAHGSAILFSSHVLPEVERLASRVAIIRAGRLAILSAVDELLEHARHRLELRYADPVPADLFQGVPGVVASDVDDKTAVITLDGPVGPAMQVAAARPGLLRVSQARDELEDLFVELYEAPGKDA